MRLVHELVKELMGRWMEQFLHRGLLQGWEPVGQIVAAEATVHNKLTEVGGFAEGEGGLVRWFWVDGSEETMWKPSLRICLRRWRPG